MATKKTLTPDNFTALLIDQLVDFKLGAATEVKLKKHNESVKYFKVAIQSAMLGHNVHPEDSNYFTIPKAQEKTGKVTLTPELINALSPAAKQQINGRKRIDWLEYWAVLRYKLIKQVQINTADNSMYTKSAYCFSDLFTKHLFKYLSSHPKEISPSRFKQHVTAGKNADFETYVKPCELALMNYLKPCKINASIRDKVTASYYLVLSKVCKGKVPQYYFHLDKTERIYSKGGLSLQYQNKQLRAVILKNYWNLDIKGAHPALLHDKVKCAGLAIPTWDRFTADPNKFRSDLAKAINTEKYATGKNLTVTAKHVKTAINTLVNGGRIYQQGNWHSLAIHWNKTMQAFRAELRIVTEYLKITTALEPQLMHLIEKAKNAQAVKDAKALKGKRSRVKELKESKKLITAKLKCKKLSKFKRDMNTVALAKTVKQLTKAHAAVSNHKSKDYGSQLIRLVAENREISILLTVYKDMKSNNALLLHDGLYGHNLKRPDYYSKLIKQQLNIDIQFTKERVK